MGKLLLSLQRRGFGRIMAAIQIILGCFVILISIATLHRFYSSGAILLTATGDFTVNDCSQHQQQQQQPLHPLNSAAGFADFDVEALSDRIDEVVAKLSDLQDKLEAKLQALDKSRRNQKSPKNISVSEFRRFIDEEVVQPLYSAHIGLRLTRIPRPDPDSAKLTEDPLINYFTVEETRKYITAKTNRDGMLSVYGTDKTYQTVGHVCVLMRKELEEYMNYDVASFCPDDWHVAQKLMLGGCDPLPRRRCLSRASKLYQRPLPINESLWTLPDDRNVRWSNYKCRNYKCLYSANPKRGFNKCTGCFELNKEKLRWVKNVSLSEFMIADVLAVKPGEIRIGLDISVGIGTFAARMREHNVTIISTAMNIGAPFAETIALRGLVPLYWGLSQRLPFFDNTMDLIHTGVFFDGWVDLQMLDFVLYDWDRVLRPGGLLWLDKFFCKRKDLDDYMYMFLQFRYRKHKWTVSFKSKDEVYLSALLEKPPRSL